MKEDIVEATAAQTILSCLDSAGCDIRLFAVYDWAAQVYSQTLQDLDTEVKNVAWEDMHLHYKVWWLITKEKVRSVHSTNIRLVALLAETPSARAILRSLLIKFGIKKNCNNLNRVKFELCHSVSDADSDVRLPRAWAEHVLSWFAERLPHSELNQRSLYLWGPAGVGKTRLVERLLQARTCLRRDCCEGFFLQELAEEYEFVWLDEFVPSYMMKHGEYRQQFNKLTGRERVLIRAKNESQYEVDASAIRTIICSNERPPVQDYFQRRMFIVHAEGDLYCNDSQGISATPISPTGTASTASRDKPQTHKTVGDVECIPVKRWRCIGSQLFPQDETS
jgi:hypothetical protein